MGNTAILEPKAARVLQADYRTCENFARGAQHAGALLEVKHWDGAGDALAAVDQWQPGAGDLWAEKKLFAN